MALRPDRGIRGVGNRGERQVLRGLWLCVVLRGESLPVRRRGIHKPRCTMWRELSCLPSCPQYCRATPTECLPFLGKPVSSRINARIRPRRSMTGRTCVRTAVSTASSDQSALATKWCSDWCAACTRAGWIRAAIGSTLLRSPGSSSPAQYERNGAARSAWPSAEVIAST